jgi:hypothetical protein
MEIFYRNKGNGYFPSGNKITETESGINGAKAAKLRSLNHVSTFVYAL